MSWGKAVASSDALLVSLSRVSSGVDSGDLTGATAFFVLWMEMLSFVSCPYFSAASKLIAGSDQDWRKGQAGSGGAGQTLSSCCGPADGHQQSGGQGRGPGWGVFSVSLALRNAG